MNSLRRIVVLLLIVVGGASLALALIWRHIIPRTAAFHPLSHAVARVSVEQLSPFQRAVIQDLERQKRVVARYRDGYFAGGDPPANIGVCTDVVIRAFRSAGVDLQQAVARDILARRKTYHIAKPDPNIDHRRCRNLARYFQAHATSLPTSGSQADWQPGDVVFWDTSGHGNADHVGMIANGRDTEGNPTVVHHWPGCPVAETDGLYHFAVRSHFRWNN